TLLSMLVYYFAMFQ
ncbi:thiC family protein, partial [Vibrio parahaemolyticus V-223/04]